MKKSITRGKTENLKNLNHSSRHESRAVSTKAGQLHPEDRFALGPFGRENPSGKSGVSRKTNSQGCSSDQVLYIRIL